MNTLSVFVDEAQGSYCAEQQVQSSSTAPAVEKKLWRFDLFCTEYLFEETAIFIAPCYAY